MLNRDEGAFDSLLEMIKESDSVMYSAKRRKRLG